MRHRQRSKAVREARMRVERANSSAKKSNSLRERLPHIISLLLRIRYLSTAAEIYPSRPPHAVLPATSTPQLNRGELEFNAFPTC